jgi:Domain of unknown function (DUF3543)
MIAGRPPFNGENHIDLLRNIQHKAVRLPPDVRVSKACVNLLRVLLNRNPLSRAGFKEFFEACDAFVALGCEGAAPNNIGTCRIPINDLGTIPENEGHTGSESLMTVATTPQSHGQQHQQQPGPGQQYGNQLPTKSTRVVTPALFPTQTPHSLIPNSAHDSVHQTLARQHPQRLAPLTQSPPLSAVPIPLGMNLPAFSSLGQQARQPWQHQSNYAAELMPLNRKPDMSSNSASTDDGEFVMVEHGATLRNDLYDQQGQTDLMMPSGGTTVGAPFYSTGASSGVRRSGSRGMLSTSPGTGGLLMGLVGRARLGPPQNPSIDPSFSDEVAAVTKMLTASEDVGRRAVSIAHLGDSRAFVGMRLVHAIENRSSVLSSSPMEGVEEDDDHEGSNGDSISAEIMVGRRSSLLSDKMMGETKGEDSQAEEMPFAISPEAQAVALPSRASTMAMYQRGSSINVKRPHQKIDPPTIRAHFGEALCCYMKALKMLKSAIGAAQRVSKDLESLSSKMGRSPTDYSLPDLQQRCHVTSKWLSQQFRGVLERADAASNEISKLVVAGEGDPKAVAPPITSVEELIYNHSLAAGRDGAVKQLLGQYEAARSCYRSAGLLAETLLMEANVTAEDREVLESYVDGFATRIIELDQLMLQQSRMVSSSNASFTNRGSQSGVIGLIGPPPAAPSGFMTGPPR